jgi:Protein of unknown function (DUF2631)
MAQHEASTEVAPAGEHGVTEHTPRHRHERPEDWGWHADLGLLARIGGVVSLIALLLMLTATHYNHAGDVALLICIGLVLGGLIWDAQKRRNSWRR